MSVSQSAWYSRTDSEIEDSQSMSSNEFHTNSSVPSKEEDKDQKGRAGSTKKLPKHRRINKFCPPRGWPTKYVAWTMVLATFLAALWSLFPNEMLPKQSLFGLVTTVLLCIAAEQLVVKVPTPRGFPPIPPLFASLLMGLMLRNLPPPGNIAFYIDPNVSSLLRKLSLTVILTRAGLEIDPEAIRKVKWAVIRLAFTPCIIETICIAIFGHLLLNFSWIWSFMMGFVMAAVSPAVVIPSLIILQRDGYGSRKGIPSLVMAASGIDDVLAITGFTILLGIAIPTGLDHDIISEIENLFKSSSVSTTSSFSTTPYPATTSLNTSFVNSTMTSFVETTFNADSSEFTEIWKQIVGIVIEVSLGILSGLLCGLVISYVPHKKMKHKSFCRGFLLLGIGIFMVFATSLWHISATGTLCALIMSFVASLRWKEEVKPLAEFWNFLWFVFQPILFGLTGTLVDVTLMDGKTVGLGLAVLGIALLARLATSTLVTFGLNLKWKERIFVSISWIPKGTVQAALCSAALEHALSAERSQLEIHWGQQILVLAVLVTLITAPIGAFGINFTGPRMLSNESTDELSVENNRAYVDSEVESQRSIDGSHFENEDMKGTTMKLNSLGYCSSLHELPNLEQLEVTKL